MLSVGVDELFGSAQFLLLVLCGALFFLDGLDTQAIGYVVPALLQELGGSRAALGPVFSSGLAGSMLGGLVAGPLADRLGRKPVLIGCAASFGALTIFCAVVPSLEWLMAVRFLAGLGLGGLMPNGIALVAESAPARLRSRLVTMVGCGYSLGAATGGYLAAWLIPAFGWRAVFLLGGVLPLALSPVLVLALVESSTFIAARRRRRSPMEVGPSEDVEPDSSSPLLLFSDGLAGVTGCLWIGFSMNLVLLYFMSNYLPTILHGAGLPLEDAVRATGLSQVGGFVGAICIGWLMDRMPAHVVIGGALAMASAFILLIAGAPNDVVFVSLEAFGVGFCIFGGQIGANAFAGLLYPTAVRATGVGWALGVGRFGSVIGPMLVSALIVAGWSLSAIFYAACLPALLAAASIYVAGLMRRLRTSSPARGRGSLSLKRSSGASAARSTNTSDRKEPR
jgi:AAHS family 4-hydroxybenzoate transporter-like MFS transporter